MLDYFVRFVVLVISSIISWIIWDPELCDSFIDGFHQIFVCSFKIFERTLHQKTPLAFLFSLIVENVWDILGLAQLKVVIYIGMTR